MFSSRLVGRLARFHGQRSLTSGSSPTAVNHRSSGQRPPDRRISSMPGARDLLHRFAEYAADRTTQPGLRRSWRPGPTGRACRSGPGGPGGAMRAAMSDQSLGSWSAPTSGRSSSSSSSFRARSTWAGLPILREAPADGGPAAPPPRPTVGRPPSRLVPRLRTATARGVPGLPAASRSLAFSYPPFPFRSAHPAGAGVEEFARRG